MDFGELLPPRSVEDILAERVRLVIGGQVVDLPVLTIRENRAWKERMDRELGLLFWRLSVTDDAETALAVFDGSESEFMDLLTSYDTTGVLPPREEIEAGLTPLGLVRAVVEVWRAARPLADMARTGMLTIDLQMSDSPPRTSSWLRNITGRLGRSSAS